MSSVTLQKTHLRPTSPWIGSSHHALIYLFLFDKIKACFHFFSGSQVSSAGKRVSKIIYGILSLSVKKYLKGKSYLTSIKTIFQNMLENTSGNHLISWLHFLHLSNNLEVTYTEVCSQFFQIQAIYLGRSKQVNIYASPLILQRFIISSSSLGLNTMWQD